MKELIIGFCELIEYGWDIGMADLSDVIVWWELGCIKDGEPTEEGYAIYNTYWEQ